MSRTTSRRRGFTLLELGIAVIVLVFLTSYAWPRFRRATEQARVDMAGSRLVMIYTAQRLYYADNQAFATNLTTLVNANLLDQYMPPGNGDDGEFTYATSSSSAIKFTATATRKPDPYWTGSLTINESGKITGEVTDLDLIARLSPPTTGLGL